MSKMALAVEKAARGVPTNKADLDDLRWLDGRIEAIESGVEAVLDIARNWSDGRRLARLHPDVSAAEYVTSRVGTLGKAVVPVLLAESNWSNRQIATVAGVDRRTVDLAQTSGVEKVNALMLSGLSQADEARLFVDFQRERRNLTSHALFTAEKVALDPQTLAMVTVVNRAGFRLVKTAGNPTDITAIDSVRYIHRYGGDDLLERTLAVVGSIWIGEEKALSGPVLKGVALFLYSAGRSPHFKRQYLDKVMQAFGPMKMLRLAQEVAIERNAVSAGPANFAEALLTQYNKAIPKGDQPLGPLTIGSKKRPAPYRKGSAR